MKRALLTLALIAAPAWAQPVTFGPPIDAKAGPVVTLPASLTVKPGQTFAVVPKLANCGTPRMFLPDRGLREDNTVLSLLPEDIKTRISGWLLVADQPGVYRVCLYAAGANNAASDVAVCVVTVGDAPPPAPPGPTPPGPAPGPAPIPGDGFRALIVYESADLAKYPAPQVSAMYSADLQSYLNSHCVKGPDGKTPEWRIWDANVPTGAESKVWQDAMAQKRDKLPWLIVSNGKAGFAGPLPTTKDEILKVLKQYGGN